MVSERVRIDLARSAGLDRESTRNVCRVTAHEVAIYPIDE